jgi:cytosine permease
MSDNQESYRTASLTQLEAEADHILGEEYEHSPVPAQARRSLFSVTMVWIGFPMIITGRDDRVDPGARHGLRRTR